MVTVHDYAVGKLPQSASPSLIPKNAPETSQVSKWSPQWLVVGNAVKAQALAF